MNHRYSYCKPEEGVTDSSQSSMIGIEERDESSTESSAALRIIINGLERARKESDDISRTNNSKSADDDAFHCSMARLDEDDSRDDEDSSDELRIVTDPMPASPSISGDEEESKNSVLPSISPSGLSNGDKLGKENLSCE